MWEQLRGNPFKSWTFPLGQLGVDKWAGEKAQVGQWLLAEGVSS